MMKPKPMPKKPEDPKDAMPYRPMPSRAGQYRPVKR